MKRVKPLAADEQDVKNFNDQGFLRKLARYALRLGRPVVEQLYALYFMLQSQDTPMRSKMVIVGALLYFVSPVDLVPDILGPLGFSDDLSGKDWLFSLQSDSLQHLHFRLPWLWGAGAGGMVKKNNVEWHCPHLVHHRTHTTEKQKHL